MYVFRKIGLLAFFEYLMHVALLQYKRTYSTSILFVFILLHSIDFIRIFDACGTFTLYAYFLD